MANEKVYVGEDGAKELYRKIKALIPGAVTVVDEVSLKYMDAVTSHAVALAIGNLTGFQTAIGTGADNHPNVAEPSTRTIYLVKIPDIPGEDKYKEWIYVITDNVGGWECIGSTTMVENAWKQWSEDNGSYATNDAAGKSIYLGPSNHISTYDVVAVGRANTVASYGTYAFGAENTVGNSVNNPHDSYVIGLQNTVNGSYQVNVFGDFNSVDQTTVGTFNTPIIGYSNVINKAQQCVIMAQGSRSNDNYLSTIIGADRSYINQTRWGTVVGNASSIMNADCATVVGSRINISKSETVSGQIVYSPCHYSTAVGTQINVAGQQNNAFGANITIAGNYNTAIAGTVEGNYDIVIGTDNTVSTRGRNNAIVIGRTTGINATSGDNTDYSGTSLISIGENHTFIQAANAYQIGAYNVVTGNNLASNQSYTHHTAVNLGVHNTVNVEGVNIGKDNHAERFGVSIGQGNSSCGGSVAIGNQLISDKWQIVIGKYNLPKTGPDRTIGSYDTNKEYKQDDVVYNSLGSTYYKCTVPVATVGVWLNSEWKEVEPEPDKALFIIGNGYGEDDGTYWDDESRIHRSNAFEVYADGTVKAKKFVSEEPELELTEGAGIQINKNIMGGTLTVSVKQPLPAAPSNPGTYALQCVVDANGNPTYSWVSVGITNV